MCDKYLNHNKELGFILKIINTLESVYSYIRTCILLKYLAALLGNTLYVEIPTIGLSVGFLAV